MISYFSKMIKNIIAFSFLVVSGVVSTHATIVQTVRLKNGSILNGYIESQDRKDNICFKTENATICLSGTNVSITEQVYKLDELSKDWIGWAESNGAFFGTGNYRTLTLNEVLFLGEDDTIEADSVASDNDVETGSFENTIRAKSNVNKVKIIEKGSVLKYVEMYPNTYRFNWSEVEFITSAKRPKSILSGIDRVYQLKNGQEVTGQYAGESYNTLSIYNVNGTVETYNINDVVKYLYKGINPNQTIFEQSKLLDVVKTKTGTYRGVIVERNFTDNANYLVIQQNNASSQIIKFKDVISYSKEENPDYSEIDDIILEEGEMVINRMHIDTVSVIMSDSKVLLSRIGDCTKIKREGNVTKVFVEFNIPRHSSADNLLLVKLTKFEEKKDAVYGFSTDIFKMNKISPVKIETSVNSTTKVSYDIYQKGVYAVYDFETKSAFPFEVVE